MHAPEAAQQRQYVTMVEADTQPELAMTHTVLLEETAPKSYELVDKVGGTPTATGNLHV